jgi:hypothetical protein
MADFLLGGMIDAATHERTDKHTVIGSSDFTTHGVIVGMTGSGKTGLGVVLIEEALRAGVPTLLIDPKGDLTNLCLTFPDLAPRDFEPWVNPGDAEKAGQSVPDYAAGQAETWTKGLAGWNLAGTDIGALRQRVGFTVYTPGSTAGVPLDVVGSLAVPRDMSDLETVTDEVGGFVSGLLGLVGIDADPLSSREHILLTNLIMNEWQHGRGLDIPTLVGLALKPPIRKLGVFELDEFFPPNDRNAFAMRLNGLLASPSFGAWMSGSPLDIDTLLRTPTGAPRCAIITTAHLGDTERQFVTTLVLSKLVTWMRRQSGTTDLRALLYMDEVAGYLPPTANPPTKQPMMTLFKQARAFGVGVVVSTQNPVDVDYKALSNAGTWMIGRLQTERDKMRLLDGMSAASGGVDVNAVSQTISGLAKREFVLRRAGKDQPEVFTSRWAMSYLRGPLTRDQIAQVMADQKQAPTAPAPTAPAPAPTTGSFAPPAAGTAAPLPPPPPPSAGAAVAPGAPTTPFAPVTSSAPAALAADESPLMPKVADDVAIRWVDVAAPWLAEVGADPRGTRLVAAAMSRVVVRFVDTRAELSHELEFEAVLTPLDELADMSRAVAVDYDDRDLLTAPQANLPYRICDAPIATKTFWTKLNKSLVDHLYQSQRLTVPANKELKLIGRPGETDEAFAARCRLAADERADADTAKLKEKYATRLARVHEQLKAAEGRVNVLEQERSNRRTGEVIGAVDAVLGGLFGGARSRRSAVTKIGRAAGARGRSATANERVQAAQGKVDSLEDQLADLQEQAEQEILALDEKWNAVAADLSSYDVAPKRTDISVKYFSLVWLPVN